MKAEGEPESGTNRPQDGRLVDMFMQQNDAIERKRTENLFKQLDERALTAEEEAIIAQRVQLNRNMLEQYEKRERQRKVQELLDICPDLTEEAGTKALELCDWREDDAACRLSSDPAFKARVSGTGHYAEAPTAATAAAPTKSRTATHTSRTAGTSRPKLVDRSALGDSVFVGQFKTRMGPQQLKQYAKQAAAQADAAPKEQPAAAQKARPDKSARPAAAAAPKGAAARKGRKGKLTAPKAEEDDNAEAAEVEAAGMEVAEVEAAGADPEVPEDDQPAGDEGVPMDGQSDEAQEQEEEEHDDGEDGDGGPRELVPSAAAAAGDIDDPGMMEMDPASDAEAGAEAGEAEGEGLQDAEAVSGDELAGDGAGPGPEDHGLDGVVAGPEEEMLEEGSCGAEQGAAVAGGGDDEPCEAADPEKVAASHVPVSTTEAHPVPVTVGPKDAAVPEPVMSSMVLTKMVASLRKLDDDKLVARLKAMAPAMRRAAVAELGRPDLLTTEGGAVTAAVPTAGKAGDVAAAEGVAPDSAVDGCEPQDPQGDVKPSDPATTKKSPGSQTRIDMLFGSKPKGRQATAKATTAVATALTHVSPQVPHAAATAAAAAETGHGADASAGGSTGRPKRSCPSIYGASAVRPRAFAEPEEAPRTSRRARLRAPRPYVEDAEDEGNEEQSPQESERESGGQQARGRGKGKGKAAGGGQQGAADVAPEREAEFVEEPAAPTAPAAAAVALEGPAVEAAEELPQEEEREEVEEVPKDMAQEVVGDGEGATPMDVEEKAVEAPVAAGAVQGAAEPAAADAGADGWRSTKKSAGRRPAPPRPAKRLPEYVEDSSATEEEVAAESDADSDEDFSGGKRRSGGAKAKVAKGRALKPTAGRRAKRAPPAKAQQQLDDDEEPAAEAERPASSAKRAKKVNPGRQTPAQRTASKAQQQQSEQEQDDEEQQPAVEEEEPAPMPKRAKKGNAAGRASMGGVGGQETSPAQERPAAASGEGANPEGGESGEGGASDRENQQPNVQTDAPADNGGAASAGARKVKGGGHRAVNPATGHTCRGRVRQKAGRNVEMITLGSVRFEDGWHNAGYIFPDGFKSCQLFRSSVDINATCIHECEILDNGKGAPKFIVTAMDRKEEPIVGKSCTSCWSGILARINSEIEARRRAGENLPPPPKTAIAGPEYFGLNNPDITAEIEALDPDHRCKQYWQGKEQREAMAAGLPIPVRAAAEGDAGGKAQRKRARRADSDDDNGAPKKRKGKKSRAGSEDEEEDDEALEAYAGNKWSGVNRTERYRKRCVEKFGEDAVTDVDITNPLPGFIDPITLEPVVNPAISIYGHVMGLATWKAVIGENGRCPFSKRPLSVEQLTTLTLNNIERFRDRIQQ